MVWGTGWKKDEPDKRDYTINHYKVAPLFYRFVTRDIPEHVDNRQYSSRVEDQGYLGSCTAHAVTSAIEYLENRGRGIYHDKSRLFTYYVTRHKIEGTRGDVGATIRGTVKSMVEYGSCFEQTWQYYPELYDTEPKVSCYQEAMSLRALKYVRLNTLTEIKTSLNGGLPVVIGFYIYDGLISDSKYVLPPMGVTEPSGGHAVLLVGYDDNIIIDGHRGALIFKNSWGTGWGEKGYGYLPYMYITGGHSDDYWALIDADFDPDNPGRCDWYCRLRRVVRRLFRGCV